MPPVGDEEAVALAASVDSAVALHMNVNLCLHTWGK